MIHDINFVSGPHDPIGLDTKRQVPLRSNISESSLSESAPAAVKKTLGQMIRGLLPNLKRSCPNPNAEADTAHRSSVLVKPAIKSVKLFFKLPTKMRINNSFAPASDLGLKASKKAITSNKDFRANCNTPVSPKAARLLGVDKAEAENSIIDLKDTSLLEKMAKEGKSRSPVKNRFEKLVLPDFKFYTQGVKEKLDSRIMIGRAITLLTSIGKYNQNIKENQLNDKDQHITLLTSSLIHSFSSEFPADNLYIAQGAMKNYLHAIGTNDDYTIRESITNLLETIQNHGGKNNELGIWTTLIKAELTDVDTKILPKVKQALDKIGIKYNDKISMSDALSLYMTSAYTSTNIKIINDEIFTGHHSKIESLYDTYKAADVPDQFIYFSLSHISKQLSSGKLDSNFINFTFDILLKELELQKENLEQGGGTMGIRISKRDEIAKVDTMISQINAFKSSKDLILDKGSMKTLIDGFLTGLCTTNGLFQINLAGKESKKFAKGMKESDNSSIIKTFDDIMLREAASNKANFKQIPDAVKLKFFQAVSDIELAKT